MVRLGVVLSVVNVMREKGGGLSAGEVRKEGELERRQRQKVKEDRLNRQDKALEVVCGEKRNLIGCHLFKMVLRENANGCFVPSLSSFYLTSFLCMFVSPSLFIFLFNLCHPCLDKLSHSIQDTVADDKVCVRVPVWIGIRCNGNAGVSSPP